MKKVTDRSFTDLLVQARFGYAVYAIKIVTGALFTVILLNKFRPEVLSKEIMFNNPMTFENFIGYIVMASIIILVFYFVGDSFIEAIFSISKRFTSVDTKVGEKQ